MELLTGEILIGAADGEEPNTVDLTTNGNIFLIKEEPGNYKLALGNGSCVYCNNEIIEDEYIEKLKEIYQMKPLKKKYLIVNGFGII